VALKVKICPNCGAGIVGSPPYCPRCDVALSYDEITGEVVLPQEPPTAEPAEEAQTEAEAASTPIVESTVAHIVDEHANTAPVPAELIGASGGDTRAAPLVEAPISAIPPAPYTPPPLREATVSTSPYSLPSNYYLEQRTAAYRQGGYDLVSYSPYQVVMAYGKPISFLWWLVALFSGVGFVWYLLILLTSGFSKDRVYLILERDGTLYEDGAGAAHVRRRRARVGRRWGFLGALIFFVALLSFLCMVAGSVAGIRSYRAELQAAYPERALFAGDDSPFIDTSQLDPQRVATAESGVMAFSILFVVALVCMLAGLSLTLVGYLHGSAYDVRVLPLPPMG